MFLDGFKMLLLAYMNPLLAALFRNHKNHSTIKINATIGQKWIKVNMTDNTIVRRITITNTPNALNQLFIILYFCRTTFDIHPIVYYQNL